ncbi:hypothetical protein KUCAC02_022308, partial [Chaenocephalus aceratus]
MEIREACQQFPDRAPFHGCLLKTEVCNYTGRKHGALKPGWSAEGPWERKTLHSFGEATEALAGAHGRPSRD